MGGRYAIRGRSPQQPDSSSMKGWDLPWPLTLPLPMGLWEVGHGSEGIWANPESKPFPETLLLETNRILISGSYEE